MVLLEREISSFTRCLSHGFTFLTQDLDVEPETGLVVKYPHGGRQVVVKRFLTDFH